MKIPSRRELKHLADVYHPYVSLAIVSTLLVARALQIDGVDKFFSISYQSTKNDQVHYGRGWDDSYLVFFLINVVTLIRFLYRKVVLEPIARNMKMSKGLTAKTIESGWCAIYYLVATAWGYVLFRDEEWWFDSAKMWQGYPHPIDQELKLYYLASLAFWLQSLLAFSFEPPRKDDTAMTFHHFLTVFLITISYTCGFQRVGAAVLMEQNAGDIFYYHAKLFKYANLETLSTIGWVSFVFVWFITRHVILGVILWSVAVELPMYVPYNWSVEGDYYFTENTYYVYVISLGALQGLMCFWFVMILKVAWRVVTGKGEIKDTTEYTDEEVERMQKKSGVNVNSKKPMSKLTNDVKAKTN